ncbi:hypothetical protein IE53DRAFT_120118 [Violaceomyces palustris]|uniref:Uncharacterized protein n=1 Tax=Violaceomyces palustris TaxID=1673888 RepID=A0ACD0NW39_9BASI|nr:hypothetical protein IE53DRAFT_120118 [Violaceomyces palustris]
MASSSLAQGSVPDPFADFTILESGIRNFTVVSLKAALKDLNNLSTTRVHHKISGNKPELTNRLVHALEERKNSGDVRGYHDLRQIIVRHGPPGMGAKVGRANGNYAPAPTTRPALKNGQSPSTNELAANAAHGTGYGSSSSVGSNHPRNASGPITTRVQFKPSPFYEIRQILSQPTFSPEAPTNQDRRTAFLWLTLNAENTAALKRKQDPPLEVRLFCTTADAYAASLSGRAPATVEFPLVCEARVNGVPLSANLRGSKKMPGRVPPPNLNKDMHLHLTEGRPNRIELTYTTSPKRIVIVAALCEITTAEALVQRLRRKAYRSKEEVIASMKKAAEDDEIQAGAATMSLKCPLSYMRMTTPCRSTQCSHVQCFDALSFYSVNEQTPSWICPVCNRAVRPDDITMDGYVDDILRRVPEDEDSVIVEPDGTWHTQDGEYSSENAPLAGASNGKSDAGSVRNGSLTRDGLKSEDMDERGLAGGHVVILDSPSPSSAPTKAQPPPNVSASRHSIGKPAPATPTAATTSAAPPSAHSEVIDLTLSSDEDEPPPPKRKAVVTKNGSNSSNGSWERTQGSLASTFLAANGSDARVAVEPPTTRETEEPTTPEDERVRRPGKRPRYEPQADELQYGNGRLGGDFGRPAPSHPANVPVGGSTAYGFRPEEFNRFGRRSSGNNGGAQAHLGQAPARVPEYVDRDAAIPHQTSLGSESYRNGNGVLARSYEDRRAVGDAATNHGDVADFSRSSDQSDGYARGSTNEVAPDRPRRYSSDWRGRMPPKNYFEDDEEDDDF